MRIWFPLSIALVLAACSDGSGLTQQPADSPVDDPGPGSQLLEIIHASPDAPAVNVLLDGEPVAEGAAYKAGLATSAATPETSITVQGLVPGEGDNGSPLETEPVTVIDATLDTPADTRVTVFAANVVADIEPIVITQPLDEVPAGEARVRVVHAAPIFDPEMVSVFVTAPDGDLDNPLETFAFGGDFGPELVPAGDYRIRITPAGDTDTVLFDSGTVPLPDGGDLVIAAIASTLPEQPLSLLVADGTEVTEIIDTRTPATVRVIHASPDAPAVDVFVNDATPPAVAELAFPEFTDRLPLNPDDYNLKVAPAGDGPGAAVIDEDVTFDAGVEYSVYAVGLVADIAALGLIDDNRRIGTEARLRLVHAAPSAGDVDIYVTTAGGEFNGPALTDVPPGAESGYLSIAPGSYDLAVTPAGGDPTAAAIGPATVQLDAGGIYTLVARDAEGGGGPFGLISLDDDPMLP